MEKDIAFLIVKRLIDDMLGRYQIDAVIVKARDREDVNIKVGMYEKWRELVSIELHKNGLIPEPYVAKSKEELERMDLQDILELRDSYIKLHGEE